MVTARWLFASMVSASRKAAEEADIGGGLQHRNVDGLLGADDRLIEAVDQIIRLAEAKPLARKPGESIERGEMAADCAGAAIAVLAAIGQMEIRVTGAFAFQRHEGDLARGPAPDIGTLDQPMGVQHVVFGQIIGDAAKALFVIRLGKLDHRLVEKRGG